MTIVSTSAAPKRLTRVQSARVFGRGYRNPRHGNAQPWQSADYTPGWVGQHDMNVAATHVRFVELPDGDVRKIRVFAS